MAEFFGVSSESFGGGVSRQVELVAPPQEDDSQDDDGRGVKEDPLSPEHEADLAADTTIDASEGREPTSNAEQPPLNKEVRVALVASVHRLGLHNKTTTPEKIMADIRTRYPGGRHESKLTGANVHNVAIVLAVLRVGDRLRASGVQATPLETQDTALDPEVRADWIGYVRGSFQRLFHPLDQGMQSLLPLPSTQLEHVQALVAQCREVQQALVREGRDTTLADSIVDLACNVCDRMPTKAVADSVKHVQQRYKLTSDSTVTSARSAAPVTMSCFASAVRQETSCCAEMSDNGEENRVAAETVESERGEGEVRPTDVAGQVVSALVAGGPTMAAACLRCDILVFSQLPPDMPPTVAIDRLHTYTRNLECTIYWLCARTAIATFATPRAAKAASAALGGHLGDLCRVRHFAPPEQRSQP